METYGAALTTVEGHNNNDAYEKARREGKLPAEVEEILQQGKNLSLKRATAARQALLDYAKSTGMATLDESTIRAVGKGVTDQKYPVPQTKVEWSQNRRVVIRIKQVEAELQEFTPPGK